MFPRSRHERAGCGASAGLNLALARSAETNQGLEGIGNPSKWPECAQDGKRSVEQD